MGWILMDKKIEGYFESLFEFVSESGWADVRWVSVSRPPGRPGGVIADITGHSQLTGLSDLTQLRSSSEPRPGRRKISHLLIPSHWADVLCAV